LSFYKQLFFRSRNIRLLKGERFILWRAQACLRDCTKAVEEPEMGPGFLDPKPRLLSAACYLPYLT
jgi:hypothetical protein